MAEGNLSGPFPTTKSTRLPVLSLKLGKMFQIGNESITVHVQDYPQLATDLFIYPYGFRMRQGWSTTNGTTKFYWTFRIDYRQIALCSFYRDRETAIWSWEMTCEQPIHGQRQVAFSIDDDNNDMPEPSNWPLAKTILSPEVIVTLELDISRVEQFMPRIGYLLVHCGRLEVSPP
ncbi:hypothetical protein BDV39DRAFT_204703 [Aspergillus sergii]|uniref:Uncharacterized protein n=1 Tax=Aspergillus sergii TaxID=1034303 RepID=A0A5N6X4E8_9EURO|nr:hypothetical protein BDV39DRAFT_204703 [Aspergillus sergii]